MTTLQLALFLLAGLLAIVELVRTRGADLVAWGVLAITAALVVPKL